jgi:hypothetical protein
MLLSNLFTTKVYGGEWNWEDFEYDYENYMNKDVVYFVGQIDKAENINWKTCYGESGLNPYCCY